MEYESPEPARIAPRITAVAEDPAPADRPAAPASAPRPCAHRVRAADLRTPWRLAHAGAVLALVLSGIVRVALAFTAGALLAVSPQGFETSAHGAGAALLAGAALTCVGDLALTRTWRRLHRPHPVAPALTLAGLLLVVLVPVLALDLLDAPIHLYALTALALPSAAVLAALHLFGAAVPLATECEAQQGPPPGLGRVLKPSAALPTP
ncbi:hypothetical protein [Glycomyces paridis]|uniref:Uncharacterized protein n=1 Tax=Glycomyces paridis TaxID=2126555 RepID=A0A4S8NVM8_9ACTN|nr:hypothetical protein [Glycomyces paridis]THV21687.1 hypothetical protein E9998_24715 [Glycomyces paridis]